MEKPDPDILLQKALALGDDIKDFESINISENYRRTKQKIKENKRKVLYTRLMQYAAFLTIPLLITSLVLGYLHSREPEQEDRFVEVKASPGSVIRYELPDNSVVWLNARSILRHPATFRENDRYVELTGEAYFEVQANSEHPFNVHTHDGLRVYVYGTKFNVMAYEDDQTIETVLEEGKVNVVLQNQENMVLEPGEYLLYDKQSRESVKKEVDVYEKVAWKDGKLVFRNASLEDIFKRLERHFNVEIQFNNRYNKEYRYRATFRNETLYQILDYLSKSASMNWKTEEPVQQNDDTLTRTKIIVDLY